MRESNFHRKHLVSKDFSGSDMPYSTFFGSKLWRVDFSFTDLTGADFRHSLIRRCNFNGAILKGALFDRCRFGALKSSFEGTTLPHLLEGIPSQGAFLAYTIADSGLIGLDVPADARRGVSLRGRKWVSHAKVCEGSGRCWGVVHRGVYKRAKYIEGKITSPGWNTVIFLARTEALDALDEAARFSVLKPYPLDFEGSYGDWVSRKRLTVPGQTVSPPCLRGSNELNLPHEKES
jgi:hypothetical protein